MQLHGGAVHPNCMLVRDDLGQAVELTTAPLPDGTRLIQVWLPRLQLGTSVAGFQLLALTVVPRLRFLQGAALLFALFHLVVMAACLRFLRRSTRYVMFGGEVRRVREEKNRTPSFFCGFSTETWQLGFDPHRQRHSRLELTVIAAGSVDEDSSGRRREISVPLVGDPCLPVDDCFLCISGVRPGYAGEERMW